MCGKLLFTIVFNRFHRFSKAKTQFRIKNITPMSSRKRNGKGGKEMDFGKPFKEILYFSTSPVPKANQTALFCDFLENFK